MISFACSLWQRVASLYAESNGIYGNFLQKLLKIFIQIKWIVCNIKTKIPCNFASSTVRLYKLAQELWNIFIYFAQLKYLSLRALHLAYILPEINRIQEEMTKKSLFIQKSLFKKSPYKLKERSLSEVDQSQKNCRWYFTNVGNFLYMFQIYSFNSFWIIMIKKL